MSSYPPQMPPEGPPPQPPYPPPYGPYPQQPRYPQLPPYPQQPGRPPAFPAAQGWAPTPAGWGAPPPYGPPRRKRTGLIVGGIIAALAMAAVVVVLIATVGPAKPNSDEDQIRALITKMESARGTDITAYRSLFCDKMQHMIDQLEQHRSQMGQTPDPKFRGHTSVKSIQINGDRARVTLTNTVGNRTTEVNVTFVKEHGEWKICV